MAMPPGRPSWKPPGKPKQLVAEKVKVARARRTFEDIFRVLKQALFSFLVWASTDQKDVPFQLLTDDTLLRRQFS